MLLVVCEHFHCLPDDIGHWRIERLLSVYRHVLKAEWDRQIAAIQSVELGTARAIAQAFSGKKVTLPDLPTFEKYMRSQLPPEARLPGWMRRFEEANRPLEGQAE